MSHPQPTLLPDAAQRKPASETSRETRAAVREALFSSIARRNVALVVNTVRHMDSCAEQARSWTRGASCGRAGVTRTAQGCTCVECVARAETYAAFWAREAAHAYHNVLQLLGGSAS